MSRERPIIFAGWTVRAILDGRKTQTRRIVKPTVKGCTVGTYSDSARGPYECVNVGDDGDPIDAPVIACPYGVPGDRLWVRETFYEDASAAVGVVYKADSDARKKPLWTGPWSPSIFMPRDASRLTLEITAVRVERLTDITGPDAYAEGLIGHDPETDFVAGFRRMLKLKADADPWVWVITFRRTES